MPATGSVGLEALWGRGWLAGDRSGAGWLLKGGFGGWGCDKRESKEAATFSKKTQFEANNAWD